MTEKKKRGRPPGSGKNKLVVPPKPETEFDADFKEKGWGVTPNKGILAVNADKFEPMPDNWLSMSRVDQLKWLTAHPRK